MVERPLAVSEKFQLPDWNPVGTSIVLGAVKPEGPLVISEDIAVSSGTEVPPDQVLSLDPVAFIRTGLAELRADAREKMVEEGGLNPDDGSDAPAGGRSSEEEKLDSIAS